MQNQNIEVRCSICQVVKDRSECLYSTTSAIICSDCGINRITGDFMQAATVEDKVNIVCNHVLVESIGMLRDCRDAPDRDVPAFMVVPQKCPSVRDGFDLDECDKVASPLTLDGSCVGCFKRGLTFEVNMHTQAGNLDPDEFENEHEMNQYLIDISEGWVREFMRDTVYPNHIFNMEASELDGY